MPIESSESAQLMTAQKWQGKKVVEKIGVIVSSVKFCLPRSQQWMCQIKFWAYVYLDNWKRLIFVVESFFILLIFMFLLIILVMDFAPWLKSWKCHFRGILSLYVQYSLQAVKCLWSSIFCLYSTHSWRSPILKH